MPLAQVRWVRALNPPIYTAAIIPVFMGASVAWFERGLFDTFTFLLTLMGLLSIQVGINLENDYFDFQRGIDKEKKDSFVLVFRNQKLVFYASIAFFAIGGAIGLYLDSITKGHLIIMIGAVGGLLGYFYSSPPFRLGYLGLGEPVSFICFGPLAVIGAYYVQANSLSMIPLLASIPIGLLVALILYIHHFPHYAVDKRYGKRTPVVRLGRVRAAKAFPFLVFFPYAFLLALVAISRLPSPVLLFLLTAPLAWKAARTALAYAERPEIIRSKYMTILLHLLGGLSLSLGFIISRLFGI